MDKEEAYKIVFNELKKIPMLMGTYDYRNGSKDFMDGIWTVMEVIASEVSEDCHNTLNIEFAENLIRSEKKYLDKEHGKWERFRVGPSSYHYICPKCKNKLYSGKRNFCPNCGKDMR